MRSIQWRGKTITFPSLQELARDHDYGRLWYDESGQSLDAYADRVGVPFRYACDVVAILSPRVSVSQNIALARSYLETGRAPGAMRQRLEALARYESSGVFTGPKITAFSSALQGDSDAVVIDAWMYRLAGVTKPNRSSYSRASAMVRSVASALGWQAAETQAALWCGVRSLCGYSDSYSPLTVEV